MNKLVFIFLLLVPFTLFAQKNKVITIDYKDCKDSYIQYLPRQDLIFKAANSRNFGEVKYIDVLEWTWEGYAGTAKSLLFFDLSSLSENLIIVDAKLSLYKHQERINLNFSASKSYALKIQKITSVWEENKVTWDNKPSFVADNQIFVPDRADLTDIDITIFVKEWLKNPKSNFGMMISCDDANYYKGLSFASSEYPDKGMRPKLTITYQKKQSQSKVPKKQTGQIDNCNNNQTIIIFDDDFSILYKEKKFSSDRLAEIINELKTGKYFVQLISDDMEITVFQIVKL